MKRAIIIALALIVVLAIAATGLMFIIISAFSQNNAVATIDGDHAVYSHHIDADAP